MNPEIVLETVKLTRTYMEGNLKVSALKDVDIAVRRHRFTMIVGPSGSGKTSFLNIAGCIDKASSGDVFIDGRDVSQMSDRELTEFRSRYVGFIFQGFNLIPVLTVFENVEYALLLTSVSKSERLKATTEILEAVQLSDHRNHKPNQLSGGQKQRVAIARALVKRPSIVFADEPTANLDSDTGAVIVKLMRDLQDISKTTFVFSTHDAELMKQADDMYTLRDGIVVDYSGKPKLERPL